MTSRDNSAKRGGVSETTEAQIRALVCANCNRFAVCVGCYEDHADEDCEHDGCTQHGDSPACDECCGHACEDGSCVPLYDEDGDIDPDCKVRCAALLNARKATP